MAESVFGNRKRVLVVGRNLESVIHPRDKGELIFALVLVYTPLIGEFLEISRPARCSNLLEPEIIGKSAESFSIVLGKFAAGYGSEETES